jgi:hypothetical protein
MNTWEDTNNQNLITTIIFSSYYRKLVETTIKTNRLRWIKSIDDSLKTTLENSWNMSLSLKRMIMLSLNNAKIKEHSPSVLLRPLWIILLWFKTLPLVILNNIHLIFSNLFSVPSISDSDVKQAILRLSPSKCVGPDEIVVSSLEIAQRFLHFLSYIFNITRTLLKGTFPTLWKQRPSCLFSRKATVIWLLITGQSQIEIKFSKTFVSIIHDHMPFYLKLKLHPSQHGFIKWGPTATSLLNLSQFLSARKGRPIHSFWPQLSFWWSTSYAFATWTQ